MSRRNQIISFIVIAIIFAVGLIFAFRSINKQSDEDLMLDTKVEIVTQYYGLNKFRSSIVTRQGGYNEATGRYHYEFEMQLDGAHYATIVYDEFKDLTTETANLLVAYRPGEGDG